MQDEGGITFRRTRLPERTPDEFLDRIAVSLGGLAAEDVLLGQRSAAQSDGQAPSHQPSWK